MLYPRSYAITDPDRPAVIVADREETLTYGELEGRANQAAHLFRSLGFAPGDSIGMLLRNGIDLPVVYWGAQRAGLLVIPLSTHLKPQEIGYILGDAGARALVGSRELSAFVELAGEAGAQLAFFDVENIPAGGARAWKSALAEFPEEPISDEISGYYLVYSSGTTGRPKGILLPFTPGPLETLSGTESISLNRLRTIEPLVSFTGAPLYHAAPLVSLISTMRLGGTMVVLRKFSAEATVRAIERYMVTYALFVPTMFVRLLALPQGVRESVDLTSLKKVMHSAAPCPVDVKRRMIEWFGPIIDEYYSGSEAVGQTFITSEEWLRKPGSVGRAVVGTIRICGEDGEELPAGSDGTVYFETDRPFSYLNDPDRTASAKHPMRGNWVQMGDIGHIDEDGYLFLTDRQNFMIISGGVNIYPQAVENLLIEHPLVGDAAVIGIPNAEFGEEVIAIVQPTASAQSGPELERQLLMHCRNHVSHISCPRRVLFVDDLPRLPTGKLAKHALREQFASA